MPFEALRDSRTDGRTDGRKCAFVGRGGFFFSGVADDSVVNWGPMPFEALRVSRTDGRKCAFVGRGGFFFSWSAPGDQLSS